MQVEEETARERAQRFEASDAPEEDLQNEIEAWLKSLGRECYYVRARMDRATTVRKGTPDFIGWHRGKPFSIECKRRGKKATPEQIGSLLWAEHALAVTGVAYTLDQFKQILSDGGIVVDG